VTSEAWFRLAFTGTDISGAECKWRREECEQYGTARKVTEQM
jgi:hypothetical protein